MWPLFQSEYTQNSASFLTCREADVSIGQDIDYNKTSFLPNGGSEGYGEMRALIFLFVLQTEFRLGNLLLQLGLEKVFVGQFHVVL